jgi:hypothetical protein
MAAANALKSHGTPAQTLTMKALSIRQPWAWLIVNGHKPVENRSWPTKYTGKLLIHAGQRFEQKGVEVAKRLGITLPEHFDQGGIVGWVDVTGCVTQLDSPWFVGPYGFTLANAEVLPFILCPGKLGFFNVEIPVVGPA